MLLRNASTYVPQHTPSNHITVAMLKQADCCDQYSENNVTHFLFSLLRIRGPG
jgi:hypothetical protein